MKKEANSVPRFEMYMEDLFDKNQYDCTGFTEADLLTTGRQDEVTLMPINVNEFMFGEEGHEMKVQFKKNDGSVCTSCNVYL
jgi:hypothetical protein